VNARDIWADLMVALGARSAPTLKVSLVSNDVELSDKDKEALGETDAKSLLLDDWQIRVEERLQVIEARLGITPDERRPGH
jgi:hypothetical protein